MRAWRAYTACPRPSWSSPRRPSPGGSKTRLTPALHARSGSAAGGRRAEDTLAAALRRRPRRPAHPRPRRRARAVDARRLRGRRRSAATASPRGSRRRSPTSGGPALPGRHGHAAGHARRCWRRGSTPSAAATRRSAPRSTAATGAIGLREADPRVFDGVPMSEDNTGAVQRARLASLGLRTAILPPLRDVDTIDDARAVAARGARRPLRDGPVGDRAGGSGRVSAEPLPIGAERSAGDVAFAPRALHAVPDEARCCAPTCSTAACWPPRRSTPPAAVRRTRAPAPRRRPRRAAAARPLARRRSTPPTPSCSSASRARAGHRLRPGPPRRRAADAGPSGPRHRPLAGRRRDHPRPRRGRDPRLRVRARAGRRQLGHRAAARRQHRHRRRAGRAAGPRPRAARARRRGARRARPAGRLERRHARAARGAGRRERVVPVGARRRRRRSRRSPRRPASRVTGPCARAGAGSRPCAGREPAGALPAGLLALAAARPVADRRARLGPAGAGGRSSRPPASSRTPPTSPTCAATRSSTATADLPLVVRLADRLRAGSTRSPRACTSTSASSRSRSCWPSCGR